MPDRIKNNRYKNRESKKNNYKCILIFIIIVNEILRVS